MAIFQLDVERVGCEEDSVNGIIKVRSSCPIERLDTGLELGIHFCEQRGEFLQDE